MLNFLTIFFKTSLITAKNIMTKKICAIFWPPDIYTNIPWTVWCHTSHSIFRKTWPCNAVVSWRGISDAYIGRGCSHICYVSISQRTFRKYALHKCKVVFTVNQSFVYNSVAIFLTPGQMFTSYNIHRQCRLHQITVWCFRYGCTESFWNVVGNKNAPPAYA